MYVIQCNLCNLVSQDVARHTFSSLAKVKRTPVDTLQLPPPRSRDIVHQETTGQDMRTSQKNCEIMLQSTSSYGHATGTYKFYGSHLYAHFSAAIFGGSTADGTHLEGSVSGWKMFVVWVLFRLAKPTQYEAFKGTA